MNDEAHPCCSKLSCFISWGANEHGRGLAMVGADCLGDFIGD